MSHPYYEQLLAIATDNNYSPEQIEQITLEQLLVLLEVETLKGMSQLISEVSTWLRARGKSIEGLKKSIKNHADLNSWTAKQVKELQWVQGIQIVGRRDFSEVTLRHATRRLSREMKQDATASLAVLLEEYLRIGLGQKDTVCTAKYGPVLDDDIGVKRHTILVDLEPPK